MRSKYVHMELTFIAESMDLFLSVVFLESPMVSTMLLSYVWDFGETPSLSLVASVHLFIVQPHTGQHATDPNFFFNLTLIISDTTLRQHKHTYTNGKSVRQDF